WVLYDRPTRRVSPLLKARRKLDGIPLRPLEPVSFEALDGLKIQGYLTRPTPDARNVPMVLVIHGGPYLRDEWGFNPTHQWLANLLTFMAAIPPYWAPSFSVWKNRLGDPDTEEGRAFLRERSPLTHIDRAFRPILIVQGLEDVRVTRAESEQMVAVLRRRNVPVTYVVFPDEGHGF